MGNNSFLADYKDSKVLDGLSQIEDNTFDLVYFDALTEGVDIGGHYRWGVQWGNGEHEEVIYSLYPRLRTWVDCCRVVYDDNTAAFAGYVGLILISIQKGLKEDGHLFVHCSPPEATMIKFTCDAIFGNARFRGSEVNWLASMLRPTQPDWEKVRDELLFYVNNDDANYENPLHRIMALTADHPETVLHAKLHAPLPDTTSLMIPRRTPTEHELNLDGDDSNE